MWSSSRPLSESSEWQRSSVTSPLTDSLQTSSMYGSFDSSPGEVSSAHRLQLVSLPLDSRPRQGLLQFKSRFVAGTYLRGACFRGLDAVITACCSVALFQDAGPTSMLSCSRCCYCISIYSRRCLGRRSLRRAVGLRFCFGLVQHLVLLWSGSVGELLGVWDFFSPIR
jgi:hypothetical protein